MSANSSSSCSQHVLLQGVQAALHDYYSTHLICSPLPSPKHQFFAAAFFSMKSWEFRGPSSGISFIRQPSGKIEPGDSADNQLLYWSLAIIMAHQYSLSHAKDKCCEALQLSVQLIAKIPAP
jgi:hypothetical protein